ncbi:MAG: dienelactone hydrolase, partial [Bacteroidota bacterium]
QTSGFINGDLLPDAPELSARGNYAVGVQTINLLHKNQVDILNSKQGEEARYDRPLVAEVWYPASLAEGEPEFVTYEQVLGNANSKDRPLIPFNFEGRASRNATPDLSGGPYPLLIVSHGYTGSRLLFTYLTENLASKGYVVVSIDHTESTFRDANAFNSTLLNRSLDVLFVLDEIERLGNPGDHFLAGLVNAELTALIGYSMGGYGVINVAGAGYSAQAVQFFGVMSGGSQALNERAKDNPVFEDSIDPRVKAVVALAPWGMERGVWDAAGLAGIKIPSFFIAGSKDDISGYEKGVKAIYDGAINSDRFLLTYLNARHNIAPNPPPPEAMKPGLHIDEYLRYADSAWDQRRINNINQHFVTAFLGIHLKGMNDYKKYLDAAQFTTEENWTGFKPRTSVGLELHHGTP